MGRGGNFGNAGALNRKLAAEVVELGFSSPAEELRAPHYLCLRRRDGIPAGVSEVLARQKVFVSVRGSSVRVSPNVYNTRQDVERLIGCLRQMAEG